MSDTDLPLEALCERCNASRPYLGERRIPNGQSDDVYRPDWGRCPNGCPL